MVVCKPIFVFSLSLGQAEQNDPKMSSIYYQRKCIVLTGVAKKLLANTSDSVVLDDIISTR